MKLLIKIKHTAPPKVRERGMWLKDTVITVKPTEIEFSSKKEMDFYLASVQFKEYMEKCDYTSEKKKDVVQPPQDEKKAN